MSCTLKSILIFLMAWSSIMAQTIGVRPIEPVNIHRDLANAITARVQETTSEYGETVDRNTGFLALLGEHGLRMAGAMKTNEDDSLALTTADIVISGQTGCSGNARWFLSLSMTDVTTSVVLCSKYVAVASYQDLIAITNTVTQALLECKDIKDDDRVTILKDPAIIMKTDTVVRTIYEREEHKINSGPRFVPCPYCGGTGKSRTGTICPYCSERYQGPETHYMLMTGKWVQ